MDNKITPFKMMATPMPAKELMKKKVKKPDLSQFDDTHYWTNDKKKGR